MFGNSAKRRLKELLEYVYRLGQMNQEPVFSIAEHGQFYVAQSQLSGCKGVHLNGVDDDGMPIWLKIERLKRTPHPEVPGDIAEWLSVSQDPEQAVKVKDSLIKTLPEQESAKLIQSGVVAEQDVQSSFQETQRKLILKDVRLRLDALPEVRASIDEFINSTWHAWAKKERQKRKTIKLYDAFFSLQQNLESQGDEQPMELVWGMGITRWLTKGKTIDCPLLEQLIEIELDNRTGAILIRPRNSERQLSIGPYFAMDNPGVEALVRYDKKYFAEQVEDIDYSPFVKESYEPLLRHAATQLHTSGSYWPDINPDESTDLPELSEELQVTDSWAIYSRPRGTTPLLQDIEKFKTKTDEIDEDALPAPTLRLVEKLSTKKHTISENLALEELDENELFFPKPYNNAQVQIIKRLENNYGVVVQGPPGTGKTHTIANIISHYLATGRRVLVTSSGESALMALREQIPESVRELTISLVSNERQGLKQLETAVQHIATIASKADLGKLKAQSEECTQRVKEHKQAIADIDEKILASGLKQIEPIDQHLLGDSGNSNANDSASHSNHYSAMALAEKLISEREQHEWFPDKIGSGDEYAPQFDRSDMKRLREARKSIGEHIVYLNVELPPLTEIPDSAQIAAIHSDLVSLEKLTNLAKTEQLPGIDKDAANSKARATKLLDSLKEFLESIDELKQTPWEFQLIQHWAKQGTGNEGAALLEGMLPLLDKLIEQRGLFIKNPIYLTNPGAHRKELDKALEKLSNGERAFGLMSVGKSEVKSIIAQIEVNGDKPNSPRQWQLVEQFLGFHDDARRYIVKWNSVGEEHDLPEISYEFGSSLKALRSLHDKIDLIKDIALQQWPVLAEELSALLPKDLRVSQVIKNGKEAKKAMAALLNYAERDNLTVQRNRLHNIQKRLGKYKGNVLVKLKDIARNQVGYTNSSTDSLVVEWQALLLKLKHLHGLQPKFGELVTVTQKISDSGAKKWAKQLLTIPVIEGEPDEVMPHHCLETWYWHRQNAYLGDIDQHGVTKKLINQRKTLEKELKAQFTQLVTLKTNMGLHENLTEHVHGALVRFVAAISKLGKGTGKKRAPRYRREAHNAMQECFDGVPCWIMPTWRISESLPSEFASFDLVIIDEASQSDITALPAVLRAKKLLIVGDDKQVSPTAAFISEDKIQQFRQSYLRSQPFADLLIPGVSLYDLSSSIYPTQRIMLTEHFRCVEPIIRFSMQYYGNELLPLRLPKSSEKIEPPLVDVYVENGLRDEQSGVNVAEICAIVDEIKSLTDNPKFNNRSIGVISLIGSEQAQAIQDALLQELGEETYQRYNIACGDSATFQGKEKDIIFLSLVVGPRQGSVLNKREYEQRFNVALSRARDRMYLFRSIKHADLKNSQDLRAQVLRHFANPMPKKPVCENPLELCQTQFEKEIYTKLTELGYAVTPHVNVGPIDIDMVVEGGNDQRIAIELDGDKSQTGEQWDNAIGDQRILERVGWVFWRCWGASYRLNPESCFADLQAALNANGVKPSNESNTASVYTEYREVNHNTNANITLTPNDIGYDTVTEHEQLL